MISFCRCDYGKHDQCVTFCNKDVEVPAYADTILDTCTYENNQLKGMTICFYDINYIKQIHFSR